MIPQRLGAKRIISGHVVRSFRDVAGIVTHERERVTFEIVRTAGVDATLDGLRTRVIDDPDDPYFDGQRGFDDCISEWSHVRAGGVLIIGEATVVA